MIVEKVKITFDSHRNRYFINECFGSLKIVPMHIKWRVLWDSNFSWQLIADLYWPTSKVAEMFQKGNTGYCSTELAFRERDLLVHWIPLYLQIYVPFTLESCRQFYTSLLLNHQFYGTFLLSPEKVCKAKWMIFTLCQVKRMVSSFFLRVRHQLLEHKQRLENDSRRMKKNEGYHKKTHIKRGGHYFYIMGLKARFFYLSLSFTYGPTRFVLAEKLWSEGISNTRTRTKRRTTLKSYSQGANIPRERFPKVSLA